MTVMIAFIGIIRVCVVILDLVFVVVAWVTVVVVGVVRRMNWNIGFAPALAAMAIDAHAFQHYTACAVFFNVVVAGVRPPKKPRTHSESRS